ncbi:hypothetical protein K3555_08445 [Leisingera sp. M527]|uniref:hypothetical protein n=1 Tax=unclassified Leisingera TaxID=2614906 RepID=UPI0021A2D34D|nr:MULTISPECIES: hypothetical protein [unclassified Leisingera]UWQ30399.1 hypothetical protein K3557_07680 [Leisingera sp. M523]UWQ34494.1 hypothetical protein K3555_08445 [Leisingera sp. M527]UWQ76504.1 hypothetical protein K3724_08770 [Leisingera sp. M658]
MAVTDQTPPQVTKTPGAAAFGAMAAAVPLSLRLEANWKLRVALLRVLGAAMILSSTGLWLVPGSGADPEMNLIRIGISVAFLLIGLVLMTTHEPGNRPEACFDPVRRELRVLQRDGRGRPCTVLRRSYDTLGGARLTAVSVQLYETDGSLLIELPIGSAAMRSQLRDQLSGAVRILT